MALHAGKNIPLRYLLLGKVEGKTFDLRHILRPSGQLLVAEQAGVIIFHGGHGLQVAVMDLPVAVADFAIDPAVATPLPILVFVLVAVLAIIRSLVHDGQVHLLLPVVSPVVPVLAERFRDQEQPHEGENNHHCSNNHDEP